MNEAIKALSQKLAPIENGNYLLGLSGGADSVALMMMLLPMIRGKKIRIEAIHVNHGMRGAESDEDERFCIELCKREDVPLHTCRADLSGRTDEDSAREARYAAFRKRYNKTRTDGLLLAHHADDQAETFLMRLLRGAGPDGLACMSGEETVKGMRVLRPMLLLRREEIRETLRNDGITWREDASNRDTAYLRNRVRHELIPVLNSFSAAAVEKICRAAALTGEDNRVLNREAETMLDRLSAGTALNARDLAKEPAALRRRVLRLWWYRHGPALKEHTLNAAQTEALDRMLGSSGGKINLPGNTHAVRAGKFLLLTGTEAEKPAPSAVIGPETVFGGFRLTETGSEGNPGDGKTTQEVPAGFTRGCIIRNRLPGDRIRPFGSDGRRKLQDYLTDRKIAEPFRDQIPLLCRGGEVLLVCGVGAGDIPKWNPELANVRLTWYGETPWNEM